MIDNNRTGRRDQGRSPSPGPRVDQCRSDGAVDMLAAARDYHGRGFCVVPQLPGAKMPCVKWKPFQDERPGVGDLGYWYQHRFPDAGIALILGPVSGLLVVDVDGEDAHGALVARLGRVPEAPTALSGSMKPRRYHLYFKGPGVPTQATHHPWHAQLEFRGYRGIVIAPPSMHKSGNRYRWADGLSLDDLPLPEVPDAILAALTAKARTRVITNPGSCVLEPLTPRDQERRARRIDRLTDLCRKTRDFLHGVYADAPSWNSNLYFASCDMCGCGYPLEDALPLLLRGARPWTDRDRDAAEATIRSAYAEARLPAKHRAAAEGRGTFTIYVAKRVDRAGE